MSVQEVRSAGAGRERTRILVLGGLVIGAVAVYLAFGRGQSAARDTANLLPYQTLIRTLPETEQQMYNAVRSSLPALETERARLKRWLTPESLANQGVAPFAGDTGVRWEQFHQGPIVNYIGIPTDPAAPAWLLAIQEPEPNAPPDPAPLDDEHHRLPDGTTLHIYVWMHRIGGRVPARFVPQPQSEGWTELFATPPSPVRPPTPIPTSRN